MFKRIQIHICKSGLDILIPVWFYWGFCLGFLGGESVVFRVFLFCWFGGLVFFLAPVSLITVCSCFLSPGDICEKVWKFIF